MHLQRLLVKVFSLHFQVCGHTTLAEVGGQTTLAEVGGQTTPAYVGVSGGQTTLGDVGGAGVHTILT